MISMIEDAHLQHLMVRNTMEEYDDDQQEIILDDQDFSQQHRSSTASQTETGIRSKIRRYLPILCLFGVCVFIGVGTPFIWSSIWHPTIDSKIEADLRFECSPLKPLDLKQKKCSEPCLWDKYSRDDQISCYYPLERDQDLHDENYLMPRYSVSDNSSGNNYFLTMKIKPPFIQNEKNEYLNKEPILHKNLALIIRHYTPKHFSVLIRPANEPDDLWSRHLDYNYPPVNDSCESEALITVRDGDFSDLFRLKIQRRDTDSTIFDMSIHSPFVFSNGYIEITTLLINDLLYGLGQSAEPFRHTFTDPRDWNLLSQYQTNLTENSTSMFGSHPFYLGVDDPKTGNSYGVFLLNTFPMQAVTNSRPSLTFRTSGGHLEFHFFLGPKPADVIRQLQELVHRPAMPPYWALGFHVCRTKCSVSKSVEIPDGIPIESDCGTSMPIDDSKLESFVQEMKKQNPDMKWLWSISPHLLSRSSSLESRWKSNVLMKGIKGDGPYKGKIMGCTGPESADLQTAYYPDFFNPTTSVLYRETKLSGHQPDGYILDQNTPLDMANQNDSCPGMLLGYPWNYRYFAGIQDKNPCLDSKFSDEKIPGTETVGPYLSLHNLYGFKHSKVVYENWKSSGRRPFLMSLSTFIGNGRFGGHISTPLNGTWPMLSYSVKQMLDLSLMGIPMTGFPVGGYKGENRGEDLMRQWYQLASMQPFMIAYSGLNEMETPNEKSLHEKIRSSVKTRYQILPYLYTLFYYSATNGDLVAQPLFFQFSTDKRTYKITAQYMLGEALMISPALHQYKTTISVYFPPGRWYDFYSGHIAWNSDEGGISDVSIVNINIHMRGGQILVQQNSDRTTGEARKKNPFQIVAAYNKGQNGILARGRLYVDSGDEIMPTKNFLTLEMTAQYRNLTIEIENHNQFCQKNRLQWMLNTQLESFKLFGIIDPPIHDQIHFYRSKLNDPDQFEHVTDIVSNHDSKFGVLNVIFERPPDFCSSLEPQRTWFFNWTYQNWN